MTGQSGARRKAGWEKRGAAVRYVAFIHRDNRPGLGIGFPDFPGCISDGITVADAVRRGGEALAIHIEGMIESGLPIPEPRSASEIRADPDLRDWRFGAQFVLVAPHSPKAPARRGGRPLRLAVSSGNSRA